MANSLSGKYVYTLTFKGMDDLEELEGVYSTFSKAYEALMYYYSRLKDVGEYIWSKPILLHKSNWIHEVTNEEAWAVYTFGITGPNNEIYRAEASIEFAIIDEM